MTEKICELKRRLYNSKLFKDSFWAVFGNGLGNALMLLAGIIIARFLGKDLYGEYGVVKTTMFYMASFSTLGLGFSSTKYIANYIQEGKEYVNAIVRDSLSITLGFSSFLAAFLIIFAGPFANYLNAPSLQLAFRFLGVVIVFKALGTTQIGILAGFKDFETIAKNSVLSGIFLLVLGTLLTYVYGLTGSLAALLLSQFFNACINQIAINRREKINTNQIDKGFKKELITFSFPIALQESSYAICNWAAIVFLTKMSSAGELGLTTAAAQWNAIIMFIPGLLGNVILSYLSGNVSDKNSHNKTIKLMLATNFVCTFIPFMIVYFAADLISGFYGPTFSELPTIIRIMTFTTIFECCSSVFKSELIAQGKTWTIFLLRLIRDLLLLGVFYFLLIYHEGVNGAFYYSISVVIASLLFFLALWCWYIRFYNSK